MRLTTTGQNERDQNIDMHWVCIICFDSCFLSPSLTPPTPCQSIYYPHTLVENLLLFSVRNVAAAWSLAPTEFPLFIFPSSVQTVSMRAELTELFIASRHTRLHLASSSSGSGSSRPRGGTGGDRAGHGAGQGTGPPGKEWKAWKARRGRERSRGGM